MRNNEYNAPLDSTPYLALLRVCRNKKISIDNVNLLLWAINADSSLTSFIRIISNVRLLIKEAKINSIVDIKTIKKIAPWLRATKQLLNHATLLVEECGEQLIKGQKGRELNNHPLKGICLVRNALYSLIWNRADINHLNVILNNEGVVKDERTKIIERFNSDFRLLQWHIFYMHHSLIEEHVQVNDYLSHSGNSSVLGDHNKSLYQSCCSARDYSNAINWRKLRKLNLQTSSIRFFLHLTNSLTEELDEEARKFKTLGTKWFNNTALLREGSHGTRHSRRRRKSTAYFVEYGDNMHISKPDLSDGPNVRVLSQWDDVNEWTEAGLPEDEAGTENKEQVLINFACKSVGTQRDQIMAGIGFAHKRAIINQHLPISYELMTFGEIATTMRTLGDTISDPTRNIQYRKAAVLGILMYWTGSNLQRVRQLVIVPAGAELADDVELAYFMEFKAWRIRVPTYKTKRKPPDDANALCRPGGEHLYLPDLWHVESILMTVSEDSKQNDGCRIYKPFISHNLSTYQKALNNIFANHQTKKGMRITPARLGNDLFLRLLSCDDPVNAMLITGKMHSSVATTRHYTTPTVKYLASLYYDVAMDLIEKIWHETHQDLSDMPSHPQPVILRPDLGIGATYCPTINEVKKLLNCVKNKLTHEKRPREYNNLYSIYTALVIGYSTGYRAVRNINLAPSRRDPVKHCAWISDKNDDKEYHTRRIWLAPVLEQHLQAYEAHRRMVYATWECHYPSIPRPEEKYFPYLFIIDDITKKVMPICSATMKQPLEQFDYPLPLNSNRKFLRTELAERGCPIDVLNSFMGHWALGQEPHGPYSCLSPRHERTQFFKYLLPLLEEIDVEVITSRWVMN